ncbi:MAG: hypothetical protein GXY83_17930 [Rhodopirellula sp.]|nr:hypothetical protein [Rhodopirellula sp.]
MGVLGWVSVVLLVLPTDACLSRCAEPIKGGLPHDEVSLIVVAPVINEAFRAELAALGGEAGEIEPGVFCLAGSRFAAYLVETDVMAARGEAVLASVLKAVPEERLANMLKAVPEERLASVLKAVPEERLASVLKAILIGKRLHGLSLEELAAGLSDEQASRLWELLEQKREH